MFSKVGLTLDTKDIEGSWGASVSIVMVYHSWNVVYSFVLISFDFFCINYCFIVCSFLLHGEGINMSGYCVFLFFF